MRGEILIDEVPSRVVNNKVLVGVEDTFAGFTTTGGIKVVNLTEEETWGDSKEFTISEFVMRYGKVIRVPEVISRKSFNYDTKVEVKPGDEVYWNMISFSSHIPLLHGKSLYLLVDYHEIIAVRRNGEVLPVNGYALFKRVGTEQKFMHYEVKREVSDEWVIHRLPINNVTYSRASRQPSDIWEVGDHVRLLVRQSPYKLEGNWNKSLSEELYACPVNYIICTV